MVIYTNRNRVELGSLRFDRADFDLADKKDFEIVIDLEEDNKGLEIGSIITEDCADCGGIIGAVKVSTAENTATCSGYTWLGVLDKKIVEPPKGEDYYELRGEIKHEITMLLEAVALDSLFKFEEAGTNLEFINLRLPRYCTALEALRKIEKKTNTFLKLKYRKDDNGSVIVGVSFGSSKLYDRNFKAVVNFTTEDKRNGTNHLICLGKGELKNRAVTHFYINKKGNVTEKQELFGLDEVTEIYENTTSSLEELTQKGLERIVELAKKTKAIIDIDDNGLLLEARDEPCIGDVIENSRDRSRVDITNKIVSYDLGRRTVQYKSESEE